MACTLTLITGQPTAGPADEAVLAAARRSLDEAEVSGRPYEMCAALSHLASCYRADGAIDVAVALFDQSLHWARVSGSTDLLVDLLCQASDLSAGPKQQADASGPAPAHAPARHDAAADRARGLAAEASSLASHVADPAWESKVLLRLSDVLDRLGDHGDALTLQMRALSLMSGAADSADAGASTGTAPAHTTLQ